MTFIDRSETSIQLKICWLALSYEWTLFSCDFAINLMNLSLNQINRRTYCQFVSLCIISCHEKSFDCFPYEVNSIYIYLRIMKRQLKRDLKTIFQYLILRSVERPNDGNTSALSSQRSGAQCLPLNLIIGNIRQIKDIFINGLMACRVSHVHWN